MTPFMQVCAAQCDGHLEDFAFRFKDAESLSRKMDMLCRTLQTTQFEYISVVGYVGPGRSGWPGKMSCDVCCKLGDCSSAFHGLPAVCCGLKGLSVVAMTLKQSP